jgi:hypothetical protein
MPYLILGVLVLLALGAGGGIGLSGANAQPETGRVLVSGGEILNTSNSVTTPQPLSNSNVPLTTPNQSTVVEIFDTRLPKVTTYTAQNISSNSATARALVNVYDKKGKNVYVVYGYDERRVRAVASEYKSFSATPSFTDDKVRVMSVDTYISKEEEYATYLSSLAGDTTYFYTFCLDYDGGHTCGAVRSFNTVDGNYRSDYFYQPSIYISQVTNIEAYSARIAGSYNMNDGKDGILFLVYGTSKNLVDAASEEENYSAIDEDDESLQTTRLATRVIGKGEFSQAITGLDRDTQYFYRLCAEYQSEDNDSMICTYTNSLTTDRRDKSDKPTTTVSSVLVAGTITTLSGSVVMNDFNDGHAFFAYGTNESYVNSVAGAGGFNRIYQYGDALQTLSLDTNVDNDENFSKSIRDLKPSTIYYYRLCSEYEDEGSYYNYTSLYLSCSVVKSFTTGL